MATSNHKLITHYPEYEILLWRSLILSQRTWGTSRMRLLTSVLRRAQTEPILSVILHVSVLETTFLVHNLHKTTSKSTLYIASQKRKFLKNDAAGVLTVCTEDHLIR